MMATQKTTLLTAEDREVVDQSLKDLIIKLARRRAWEDHVAALETRRN